MHVCGLHRPALVVLFCYQRQLDLIFHLFYQIASINFVTVWSWCWKKMSLALAKGYSIFGAASATTLSWLRMRCTYVFCCWPVFKTFQSIYNISGVGRLRSSILSVISLDTWSLTRVSTSSRLQTFSEFFVMPHLLRSGLALNYRWNV